MPVKRFDAGIRATAILMLATVFSCGLAVGQERTDSGLWFSIDDGDSFGIFPVNLDPELDEVVSYDLLSGEVQFSVGDVIGGDFQDPLFCFGTADNGSSQVKLRVFDANGHVVVENFGLSSSLLYDLSFDSISVRAPKDGRCFYKDGETFGLFGKSYEASGGREDPADPDDRILLDAFSGYPDLTIRYSNLLDSVNVNQELNYNLEIENSGNGAAQNVAFQEVLPINGSVYNATLDEGTWFCFDGGSGACPASSGSGPLRFENMEIPAGATVNFDITRKVTDDPLASGHAINLYAGVVAGSSGFVQFDTAEKVLGVVGEPAAVEFEVQPSNTVTGEFISPAVVVHVVDVNGNRVTGDNSSRVKIELRKDGSAEWDLTAYETVEDGRIEFDQLSMGDVVPDTGYSLVAWPEDLGISIRESQGFEVLSAP